MMVNSITWQDILSFLSKHQNLFGLLFIGFAIYFSKIKKSDKKIAEGALPGKTSSDTKLSGNDSGDSVFNWNSRNIASYTISVLVAIVVLFAVFFPKVVGFIILGILLLSLFVAATKVYSHFFNKKEKVSETSSSVVTTSEKKTSWKKFWRGLVIVLLVLLVYVISLFFWKDGPWGINHTIRKMLSMPFTVLEGKHFKKGAIETVYIEPGGDIYYQADAAKGDWEIEVSNPDYPEDGSKKYGSNTPIDPNKKLHYGTLRIVFLTDTRDFAVIANKR